MKYLMLLVTFIPTILWGISILGLIFLSTNLLVTAIFVSLIPLGMIATKLFVKNQRFFFRPIISKIGRISEDNWIPIELEKSGTEDKLHIFADDFGVIHKHSNQLHITTSSGEIASGILDDLLIIAKISKFSLSCRLVTKKDRIPICDYNFSPKYSGKDIEIAGDSEKRIEWLSNWLGISWETSH